MEGRDTSNHDDPMVKKCLELVTMWWAQAGQYQVLPLDDRFQARALDREALYAGEPEDHLVRGRRADPAFEAPLTLNRSWSMVATIEVPDGGATGPIAAMGGDCAGWSLYLNDGVPTYCYNFPGPEYTYLRGTEALPPGRHEIGYTFEKTGSEPLGAAGIGRLTVDGAQVAGGEIPRTCTVGYSIDETFDIGWDKGSPVSEDYGPVARFTGRIIKVDFDAQPDLHPDHDDHHAEAKLTHAMIRQ
jgi:arylsulfatase